MSAGCLRLEFDPEASAGEGLQMCGPSQVVARITESRIQEGGPERRVLWKAYTGRALLWTDPDTGVVQGSGPVPWGTSLCSCLVAICPWAGLQTGIRAPDLQPLCSLVFTTIYSLSQFPQAVRTDFSQVSEKVTAM